MSQIISYQINPTCPFGAFPDPQLVRLVPPQPEMNVLRQQCVGWLICWFAQCLREKSFLIEINACQRFAVGSA